MTRSRTGPAAVLAAFVLAPVTAGAQDAQDLAKQLANPVADLRSVPFQFNYDRNLGTDDDGERLQLNIQPVLPFDLTNDWLVISRTILPVVYQDDVVPARARSSA